VTGLATRIFLASHKNTMRVFTHCICRTKNSLQYNVGFNFVAKVVLDRTEEHPQGEPLSLSVPPCVPGPPGHCTTSNNSSHCVNNLLTNHISHNRDQKKKKKKKNALGKNVFYPPKNVPWVETYMRKVAEINGMDFESSFVAMGSGNLTLDGLIADNATIYNYVVDNPNVTQHAVIFPAGSFPFTST